MDTPQIAETMVATWQRIDAALTPIIGPRGVDALYQRSVKLNRSKHPWLAGISDGLPSTIALTDLLSVLAQQDPAETATGSHAVLNTFHELLANLIGRSLTARLLDSVWDPASSSPPPLEPST